MRLPMGLLVADCPRCGSKQITFDVVAQVFRETRAGWQTWHEVFCVCRACHCPTVFLVCLNMRAPRDKFTSGDSLLSYSSGLNEYFEIQRFISLRDNVSTKPPGYLPKDIENAFVEGAACLSIECYNAAATMFRLCVDLVTRPLLPGETELEEAKLNRRQRRDLGLRLAWLFDNGILPSSLRELAKCIREDANDGAHVGNLTKEDAEDLLDFTNALLERLITEPKKLEIAEKRRESRRSSKD